MAGDPSLSAGSGPPGRGSEGREPPEPTPARRVTTPAESRRASRTWWDANADDYQAEHGDFLGAERFVWGPEGLDEADARLLGDVAGRTVLEIGCGAAQCSRWLRRQGAFPVGLDISERQLRYARDTGLALVAADATALPFRSACFDLACSAYGALPFVADADAVMAEVTRVLRPGGRWVFSVTHPVRWCFPDDPGGPGLVAGFSYFDRTPYVEEDESGVAVYVEHHRTMGDWVRAVVNAGLRVLDVVEPEWPDDLDVTWGQWSALRGRVIPGTAIFRCVKPST